MKRIVIATCLGALVLGTVCSENRHTTELSDINVDLNNDGKRDIILHETSTFYGDDFFSTYGHVLVKFSTQDGKYSAPKEIHNSRNLEPLSLTRIFFKDVDGDGLLDLRYDFIRGRTREEYYARNNGNGTFDKAKLLQQYRLKK